jgi:hypothetical protein
MFSNEGLGVQGMIAGQQEETFRPKTSEIFLKMKQVFRAIFFWVFMF